MIQILEAINFLSQSLIRFLFFATKLKISEARRRFEHKLMFSVFDLFSPDEDKKRKFLWWLHGSRRCNWVYFTSFMKPFIAFHSTEIFFSYSRKYQNRLDSIHADTSRDIVDTKQRIMNNAETKFIDSNFRLSHQFIFLMELLSSGFKAFADKAELLVMSWFLSKAIFQSAKDIVLLLVVNIFCL